MKYRELLKEVLKSVKSGKLHVTIRLIFLALLFAFSAVSIYDIGKYFLRQKSQITVIERNLKWGFDWRKKSIWILSDYLSVENPHLNLELTNLKFELDLFNSIKKFSLVINDLEFTDGKLLISNVQSKKSGKVFLPKVPLKINKLKIQKFTFLSENTAVMVRKLFLSRKSLTLGGITGRLFKHKFQVLPLSGYYSQNRLIVPEIQLILGNATVVGRAEIYSLDKLSGTFKLRSKNVSGEIVVNRNNAKVVVSWHGSLKGVGTVGKGVILLSGRAIRIAEASGTLDGLNFSGRGSLTKAEVNFKGTLSGAFKYGNFLISGLKSRFSLSGNFKSPNFSISGTVKELNSSVSDLKNLWFKCIWNKNSSRVDFSSSQVSGIVTLKPNFVRGNLNFRNFNLKSLKPLSRYAKYQKWIPKVTFSGNLSFTKRNGTFDFKTNLSLASFRFSNFKGSGNLSAAGKDNTVKFTVNVYNAQEKVKVRGRLNLSKLLLSSQWKFENVELSEFKFLKKLGLGGRVFGEGKLSGSLKNPKGEFAVYSKKLKLWNVPLKNVKGKVTISDFWLGVEARNPKITLNELKVFLKKPHTFSLRVKVNDVPATEIAEVANGFKVRFPFELSGGISGILELKAKNPKQKRTYFGSVEITKFHGEFRYGDFFGLVSFRGGVSLFGLEKTVKLYGKLERGKLKNQKIEGAQFSLKIKNDLLKLKLKNLKVSLPINNSSEGEVDYSFKDKSLKANFRTVGVKNFSFGVVKLSLLFSVFGDVGKFTVKLNGNLNLQSKLISKPIKLTVKGELQKPKNFGIVTLSDNQTDVKVIFNGKTTQAVGSFRNVCFSHKLAKITINFGFINVDLSNLTGTIAIPAFVVKPKGFYSLYSVSGIYIKLKDGKPEISEFTLSYLDGWLKVYGVNLQNFKSFSGHLEANLGIKGLIYLLKINNVISYARNNLYVKGKFSYDKKFSYTLNVTSNQVEVKPKYLLNKAIVTYLNAKIENGKVENIRSIIESGTGNVEIVGTNSRVSITVSSLPVGELNKWKGLISGNVKLANNKVSGEINVSKAKLIIKKEKQPTSKTQQVKFPIKVDVNVLFSEPVKLQGQLFWVELIPKLKLATQNHKLAISGTFLITNGEINYMGKIFKVIYGSGEIRNLQELKGNISLIASTHISGYYVYMKIQGKLKSPIIFLTSDPPLTRSQILNLVMTGASPEEIESSSEMFPAVQVAYYATSSFFKPVEEQFKKTLNLERFSIEPYITKYGETVAKLTLVKKLSERIKLTGYGTTGQNPEYGGSVKYKLGGKYYLELRYNSYYGPEAGIGIEVNRK